MSVFLGFDYGSKRIGVAVGDDVTRSARPLTTLGRDWAAIQRLVAEWNPRACVVGLPLTMDGGEQPASTGARRFAAELARRCEVAVHQCDERLSSIQADSDLRARRGQGLQRRRLKKTDVDAQAASIILEQWLTQQ